MSVALLQNNEKHNELEDDRESCLHVLTWMALRLTKHTISGGTDLNIFLKTFDEAHDVKDGVWGGLLKEVFLLRRRIPKEVKFNDRPHLDKLIRDLTETFAVRYEEPPTNMATRADVEHNITVEDPDERERLSAAVANVLNSQTSYQERMKSLKERNWVEETFRRHLKADPWPTEDC
jgi:hypothetical protein